MEAAAGGDEASRASERKAERAMEGMARKKGRRSVKEWRMLDDEGANGKERRGGGSERLSSRGALEGWDAQIKEGERRRALTRDSTG